MKSRTIVLLLCSKLAVSVLGVDNESPTRKRSVFVELEAPDPPTEFEISAEEEARLERFLQATSLSLSAPTTSPTAAPTGPTASPTDSPSTIPSAFPSERPSLISDNPSAVPSVTTSAFPSETPTVTISASPSESAIISDSPSESPTLTISANPSGTSPTKAPTKSPTDSPTEPPTKSPTEPPTKSPTDSPNVSPTKNPTPNPTPSSTSEAKCRDDPNFYHKFPMRTCAFIDEVQWRRDMYCKIEAVYEACERTCGTCCEDTPSWEFTFPVRNIDRTCFWITKRANRPGLYCDQAVSGGGVVSDYCPEACGTCRSVTIAPTAAPVSVCTNDSTWNYMNTPRITCKWIRNKESRREEYCSKGAVVTANCPQSCGLCCEDHPNYEFLDTEIRKDITCAYIKNGIRRLKYCDLWRNGNMVRDICPVACRQCKTPIGATASCQNNPDWNWFGFPTVTCNWIRNVESRREDFCNRNDEVKEECPQACGVCCEDDETYSMDVDGEQTCSWVGYSETRINKYCDRYKNGRMVRDACPVTCDRCLDPV